MSGPLVVWAVGYMPAAFLISGMIFSDMQFAYPNLARKDRRTDAGMAIFVGVAYAIAWPVALPVAWLVSGFAEHGIWRVPLDV